MQQIFQSSLAEKKKTQYKFEKEPSSVELISSYKKKIKNTWPKHLKLKLKDLIK